MTFDPSEDYSFEAYWSSGIPAIIESELRAAISDTVNKSAAWHAQINTQLALTLALQQKFADAHVCLDEGERCLGLAQTGLTDLQHHHPSGSATTTHVRLALERGRVFHQAGEITKAREFFDKAQQLAASIQANYYLADALHMLAIIAEGIEEKLSWNEKAIRIAETAVDTRAKRWLGSLWNNKGQWLFQQGKWESSFAAYERALQYRIDEQYLPNIRFAQWTIARGHRMLGQFEQAKAVLNQLDETYRAMKAANSFDFPEPLYTMFHGIVLEELALVSEGLSRSYAEQALELLAHAPMVQQHEPFRLEQLRRILSQSTTHPQTTSQLNSTQLKP